MKKEKLDLKMLPTDFDTLFATGSVCDFHWRHASRFIQRKIVSVIVQLVVCLFVS